MTDRPDARAGVVVDDRFVLCAKIGDGAMAEVYRARDRRHGEWVALKLLRPLDAGNRTFEDALTAESSILAQIRHRHVVDLVGTGRHAGAPYIAMEHLGGGSLHRFLHTRPGRRLDVLGAVSVLEMACRGVQAVHDAGFAHCDLKARNILLDRRGRAVVADLGLAHRTTSGGHVEATILGGTADYMAPEVIAGSPRVLAATLDVYALGVLAFVLLTGRRPFDGRTAQEVFSQHVAGPAPSASTIRSDLPSQITAAIGHALESDPAQRTASASDFETALAVAVEPLRRRSRRGAGRHDDHR